MTDEQLSALLRLKRHEQPPPQYFENLLDAVQRRQRSELLRRPLWRIAIERVQTFFSEHSMGNFSYGVAMTATLVVGIGSILMLTPGGIESRENAGTVAVASTPRVKAGSLLSLEKIGPALPAAFEPQLLPAERAASRNDRRYVIDARPVSYEPEPFTRF